ncbi:MAG TPA: hypothetical protein VF086_09590 [Propionibacteriaceae bacterium]
MSEDHLSRLLAQLGTWLDLPDPGPTIASCAAAATVPLDGEEAAWLLNVAAPSAGKTEAVNLLDNVTNGRLNEITSAGLLGWSRGKNPHPVGILTRIPGNAMVTFGDLSSLLATSDRGGRDQVFGLLRRAYDGQVTRDVTPSGGSQSGAGGLEWSGRLTVVAAVTNAIDRYTAHADALGPRWLYVRAEDRPLTSRRSAAKAARQAGVREARAEAITLATDLVMKARAEVNQTGVPDKVADTIEDAVLVTCWGRAAVPRNGYGRREIEDVAIIEEPPRLIRQCHVLARGLYAVGLDDQAVDKMMRRIALDSMPAARLAVLRALATEDGLNTSHIAQMSGLHWNVAFRHCEDMAVVGVADDLSGYDEHREHREHRWALRAGEEGDLIRKVIGAELSSSHEKWSQPPPEIYRHPHISCERETQASKGERRPMTQDQERCASRGCTRIPRRRPRRHHRQGRPPLLQTPRRPAVAVPSQTTTIENQEGEMIMTDDLTAEVREGRMTRAEATRICLMNRGTSWLCCGNAASIHPVELGDQSIRRCAVTNRMVLGVDLARRSFRRRRWTPRDQLIRPGTRSIADSGAVRQDLRSKINRARASSVQAKK